jgi:phosphatidate cytidylyltransferase
MTTLSIVQLAWVAAILLLCGLMILSGLMLTPRGRPLARSLVGSAGSLVLTIIVLFAAFLGGTWVLGPFLVVLAARVGFEAGSIGHGRRKGALVSLLSAGAVLLAISSPFAAIGLAGLWMVLFGRLIGLPWRAGSRFKSGVELAVFPVLPMALLAHGAMDEGLAAFVLLAYILIETFDSYALVFGKLFGRRQAFPLLSPRKTVEGLFGGTVFLILTVVFLAAVLGGSMFGAAMLAVVVGALGLAGDLTASRLKRAAGVKDFPVVLGHQGGALDIFDSWIAAGAGLSVLSILSGLA